MISKAETTKTTVILSTEAVLFTEKEIKGNCIKEKLLKIQKDPFSFPFLKLSTR